MSHAVARFLAASLVFLAGCGGATPAVAPGGVGLFARYLPPDARVDPPMAPDSRSGEVAPDDHRWPPTPLVGDCTNGKDEVADFEAALGETHASTACPALQLETAPGVSTTTTPTPIGAGDPLHPGLYCFAQGHVVIVVGTTEHLFAPKCRHVVSVGVYPVKGEP